MILCPKDYFIINDAIIHIELTFVLCFFSADLLMLGRMFFVLLNHNSHANTCTYNWLMFQEGFQIQMYLKNIQCTIH